VNSSHTGLLFDHDQLVSAATCLLALILGPRVEIIAKNVLDLVEVMKWMMGYRMLVTIREQLVPCKYDVGHSNRTCVGVAVANIYDRVIVCGRRQEQCTLACATMPAGLSLMWECRAKSACVGQLHVIGPIRNMLECVMLKDRANVSRESIADDPQVYALLDTKVCELSEACTQWLRDEELEHCLVLGAADRPARELDTFSGTHITGVKLSPYREGLRFTESIEELVPYIGRYDRRVEIAVDFIQSAVSIRRASAGSQNSLEPRPVCSRSPQIALLPRRRTRAAMERSR
jgi:hypothetical protein